MAASPRHRAPVRFVQVWLVAVALLAGHARSAGAGCWTADSASVWSSLRPRRLALLGGAGLGMHYAGFRYFDKAWYQGEKQDHIRWIADWSGETYLNLDKAGHFMGGMVMSQSLQDGLTWGGLPRCLSAILGTAVSWGVMLEIEMKDAYYNHWGFSIPDFAANTTGATVPLLHALVPATQVLQFKMSYHPSRLYLDRQERRADDRPHVDALIDDYEGMTLWAALQLDRLLPARAAARWPDCLGIAAGYGATGLHGANVKSKGPNKYYRDLPDAEPELFLALDYDTRALPGSSPLWRAVKTRLNWIHWPAPAVRLRPSLRLYLLYL